MPQLHRIQLMKYWIYAVRATEPHGPHNALKKVLCPSVHEQVSGEILAPDVIYSVTACDVG
jgi:hypothetical protein